MRCALFPDPHNVGAGQIGLVAQGSEDGVFLVVEVEDRVELGHDASRHNDHPVVERCGRRL